MAIDFTQPRDREETYLEAMRTGNDVPESLGEPRDRKEEYWYAIATEGWAKQDGEYDDLTAGFAKHIISPDGTTQNAHFSLRTTAGNESIDDDSYGVAESINGQTAMFNQMCPIPATDKSGTASGVTMIDNRNGTYTMTGTATATDNISLGALVSITSGHKYAITGAPLPNNNGQFMTIEGSGLGTISGKGSIATATATGTFEVRLRFTSGTSMVGAVYKPNVYDLTMMFGSGNEPTDIGEFLHFINSDFNAYNEGTPMFFKPTALQTVGFNQWDEQWESGKYNSSGEKATDASSIRSKNLIPVLPSTTYYYYTSGSYGSIHLCFYSAGGTFINTATYGTGTITTSAGACYMSFYVSGTKYSNDICINISHSGTLNGTYEEYEVNRLDIDTDSYFPTGLKSAGSVYDELDLLNAKAIQRLTTVDLGNLTYTKVTRSGVSANIYEATIDDLALATAGTDVINAVCAKFDATTFTGGTYTNGHMSYGATTGNKIDFYSSYTTVDAFKAAMTGVTLVYELEDEITTTMSTGTSGYYDMNDYGTEAWVVESGYSNYGYATLRYGRNLVDEIRNVRQNCLETGTSLNNLLTAIGTATNKTITKAWDSTNKVWTFTVS